MTLSAALNLAVLALIGQAWPPVSRVVLPPPPPHLMLLSLLPPPPKISRPHPRSVRPRPKPRPAPPPKIVRKATPLPPAPHRPRKVAPVAAQASGARPHPLPRPQMHLIATPSPTAVVPQAPKTVPAPTTGTADTPAPSQPVPSQPVDSSPPPVAASGTGNGTGQGSGQGAGTGAGTGTGPFGITGSGGGGAGPRHVAYLLDISGSMSMPVDKWQGQTRIQRARAELDAQLKSLEPGETFTLIAFSSAPHPFQDQLVPATPANIQAAETFLQGLTPDGDTDLEGALDAALAMPGVNVIYVITDGVPRTPDEEYTTQRDFDALAGRLDTANRQHARIYTIGLLGPNPDGTNESAQAASLLSRIAADSGGTFKAVALDAASQDSGGS